MEFKRVKSVEMPEGELKVMSNNSMFFLLFNNSTLGVAKDYETIDKMFEKFLKNMW